MWTRWFGAWGVLATHGGTVVGRARPARLFGVPCVRVDVPRPSGTRTQFVAASAVLSFTPAPRADVLAACRPQAAAVAAPPPPPGGPPLLRLVGVDD